MMAVVLGLWSLGSAAMLAWGTAAAIPLLLHLWSRRRHQEIAWAAMPFLLAALKKQARRIQIEQLVLLAVRMLLLLLFAVAVADPLWSRSTAGTEPQRAANSHFVLVIDSSFSMAFRKRDQTHFQVAQEQLRRLVESSQDGDGFSLLVLDRSPRSVIADVAFDRGELLSQIARLQVSHGGADLAATVTLIEQRLRQAQERHPRLTRHRIVFCTDLGQNSWSVASTAAVGEALQRLASSAEISLVDVGLDDRTNLAVTALSSSPSTATPGEEVEFTAEVVAFGPQPSTTTRVEFLRQGRVAHVEELTLAAGERRSASWKQAFESAGDQVIIARIAADDLPLDNERYLVLPVRPAHFILAVEGKPGEAEFVALALNPDGRSDAPIQIKVGGESSLLERDLATYDGVFLCNVGRLTSFEAEALQRYVTDGGGLVISLGDQIQADEYNRQLAQGGKELLPARLEGVERGESFFDPLEYQQPLTAPFRGRERAGLLTVPTWCYFRLAAAKKATVALAFTSGHPAIVERQIGRGRSILVATALSPTSLDRTGETVTPWSALPAWPSFPPLVHGLLQMAIRGHGAERTVEVGTPLLVSVPDAVTAVTVLRPGYDRERVHLDRGIRALGDDASHSQRQLVFSDTSLCGIYHLESADANRESRAYAVNLDSRESDLRRLSRSLLPDALRNEVDAAEGLSSLDFSGDLRHQLYRPLLLLVALLLLVEQWLVGWSARQQPSISSAVAR